MSEVLPAVDLDHHGDVEATPGLLDFAVNVHGTEPPPFLADALRRAVGDLARYPDAGQATAAVARAHGVPPECVLLTHGAAEAFTLVARRPWARPAVVHPQFTEPEAALRAAGHLPDRLQGGMPTPGGHSPLSPETFGLDVDPGDADLVMVGNPTNPTSRLHPRAAIEALAARGRLVVVDEAFLDAVEPVDAPRDSLARTAAEDPRFLVVRSLTKTYAIAGLRIGYLVGHPGLLADLGRERGPWPTGTLASVAAETCLGEEGRAWAARLRRELPGRLEHLARTLEVHGLEALPGARAPFVLARHPEAVVLRERLRDAGIAVRRGDTFPGLDGTWLRFAAREPAAVEALGTALGVALGNALG